MYRKVYFGKSLFQILIQLAKLSLCPAHAPTMAYRVKMMGQDTVIEHKSLKSFLTEIQPQHFSVVTSVKNFSLKERSTVPWQQSFVNLQVKTMQSKHSDFSQKTSHGEMVCLKVNSQSTQYERQAERLQLIRLETQRGKCQSLQYFIQASDESQDVRPWTHHSLAGKHGLQMQRARTKLNTLEHWCHFI